MNILVFTNLFPNSNKLHHGIFIKERVSEYKKFGHKTLVVCPIAYTPILNKFAKKFNFKGMFIKEKIDDLDVYYYKYFHIPLIGMILQPFLMFIFGIILLASLNKKYKFDIIDAHYLYPDGVTSYFFSKWFKLPLIQSARGSDVNKIINFLIPKIFIKKSLSASSRIITVSKQLKYRLQLIGVSDQKIKIIPNGVNRRKFYYINSDKNSENQFHKKNKTILMIGNLIKLKGQHILVEALKILDRENTDLDIECLFIGTGNLDRSIEQAAKSFITNIKIQLIGPVLQNRLVDYYNDADLLCLLSESEGCPNVVLEALTCGLPVLATNVGDLSSIINENIGRILPERNPRVVSHFLKEVLNISWDKKYISKYAEQFSWESISPRINHVLLESKRK